MRGEELFTRGAGQLASAPPEWALQPIPAVVRVGPQIQRP